MARAPSKECDFCSELAANAVGYVHVPGRHSSGAVACVGSHTAQQKLDAAPRYVAYVVARQGEVAVIDVGMRAPSMHWSASCKSHSAVQISSTPKPNRPRWHSDSINRCRCTCTRIGTCWVLLPTTCWWRMPPRKRLSSACMVRGCGMWPLTDSSCASRRCPQQAGLPRIHYYWAAFMPIGDWRDSPSLSIRHHPPPSRKPPRSPITRSCNFHRTSGVGSGEARLVTLALASARHSNCTCGFPACSFHDDAPWRVAREGMRAIRFTSPNSP
jgi:hypothetical protein